MSTLAQSLVSSSSRKLPIRVRPDLEARKHRYQGRIYWVVKDPVALQYFRFEEEEFSILRMLDGESSLDDVAERFEAEFPPQTIRTEELLQFIGMLHRSGLVMTDAAGQGVQLKKRRDEKKKKERLAMVSNVLSLRFKGIDPDRLLNFLYPMVRWFFTTTALVVCLMLAAAALSLVLVQFDVFQSRLPSFQTFFAQENWLLLAMVLGATKIMHEFGHGMSCKHFGGECHEMGVMLLVLTPCLYCNVSDSWMLPNRWHRAAIGAAGMYVEVVLASICTFIWWFTEQDSALNNICLNIMFVSSVSTVMFNANPLLRYDGYYILSDVLEIPNLRQKASTILQRKLGSWCLGLEEPDDPFLPKSNQGLFALYTVASAVYRWVVVLSILYFLNKVFEPYGLKVLGQFIALGALYGLVVQPIWKLFKFFRTPGKMSKVKRGRLLATFGVVAVAVILVLTVPLPSSVIAPVVVQPQDAETVYVETPGQLVWAVEPGARVEKGDVVGRLRNPDIELQIVKLEGQSRSYETQIATLKGLRFNEARAVDQLLQLGETLDSTNEQLAQQREDAERLTLRATRSGVVIPPDHVAPPKYDDAQLEKWSGSPLDKDNLGASLEQNTEFCRVGDPRKFEALVVIDQRDIEPVQQVTKPEVEVMLDQLSGVVYRSWITQRAGEAMSATPSRLSSLAGGPIPTQMDSDGVPRPQAPFFEATIPLPTDDTGVLRVGLVGQAKIHTPPRTLWQRLWRFAARTFNFEL